MTSTLSDRIRTVAARLCTREETQLDGRMLLAFAEEAGTLESERATIAEQAEEIIVALNDPVNGLAALTATLARLQKRPARAVDGANIEDDRRRSP